MIEEMMDIGKVSSSIVFLTIAKLKNNNTTKTVKHR